MTESLSGEQVRENHILTMGPKLGSEYNALMNDVIWLHAKWNQYRKLYGSPERVCLLNKAAGHFFGVMQDTVFEDVLLHLARLTDSPKSVGKDNLTLRRMPELVSDAVLASDLRKLVEAAREACKSAQAWRNRRLAHRDLNLALATSADPLPGVSRDDVETALRAIRAVLNRLARHYLLSETAYQQFIPAGGDADSLVYHLCRGVRADEQQMERLLQGKPLPEDLEDDDSV